MFNHAAKEELIDRHDVPYFPMAAGVDNIRRTVASKELLENILNEIFVLLMDVIWLYYMK